MTNRATLRPNLRAQYLFWSALFLSLPVIHPTSTLRAQTASSSKPQWKSEFRLASTTSLTRPSLYTVWLPRQSRANPSFDLRGGVLMQSPRQSEAACRRIDYDQDPNSLAMEWQMNAPKFELLCAPPGGTWRVLVRDTNVPTWTVLGEWNSIGWNAARVQVLSDVTATRRPRRFRVEYANQLAWGIRLEGREPLVARPPYPFPRRVMWCGDSFVEGVYSPSMWQGFAAQASNILGLDAHFDASGGTGYINDGISANPKRGRYSKRLSNIVASNPSLVVIYGSINDLQYPPAQVASAARTYWSAIRKSLPQAQIVVIGPVRMGSSWNVKPLNDALRENASRSGLPFIDASNWITGSGKMGAPRRDGNADQFCSSDGAHPTLAGHTFLGQKVAESLRPLINPK